MKLDGSGGTKTYGIQNWNAGFSGWGYKTLNSGTQLDTEKNLRKIQDF